MGPAVLVMLLAAANPHLDEGRELYRAGDFSGALKALIRALDGPSSKKERALVHAYIGLIQHRYDLQEDARASFAEALQYDPDVQFPDPTQHAAKKLFTEMRREPAGEEPEGKLEPKEKEKDRKKKKRTHRARARRGAPLSPGSDPEGASDEATLDLEDEAPEAENGELPRIDDLAPTPGVVISPAESADAATVGGFVGLAAGGVGLAGGIVFAVLSSSNGRAALDEPVAQRAEELHAAAVGQRTISIVSFAVAGVSLGVAAYLLLAE